MNPAEPLDEIFDRVMRMPESQRGIDVEVTARLLAEELKRTYALDYANKMLEMEAYYLDQFLNSIVMRPGLAARIRTAMSLYR